MTNHVCLAFCTVVPKDKFEILAGRCRKLDLKVDNPRWSYFPKLQEGNTPLIKFGLIGYEGGRIFAFLEFTREYCAHIGRSLEEVYHIDQI